MKRIIVVTGASSGLGKEFVKQISQKESVDEIWAIARRTDRLNELAPDIDIFIIPDKAICLNQNGETFFNAYRIETEGGTPEKNLLALNPTLCGSFHMPQFFIPLDTKA